MVALLIALLGYGLASRSPSDRIDDRLAGSRPAAAPGFELPVLQRGSLPSALESRLDRPLEDGRLSIAELRGTPTVINFWASWCPPCRSEKPRLERAWRSARRSGVLYLGLNIQDVSGDAQDFLREFSVSYPNVRDRADEVARRWGVVAMPETFFVDRRGRVVAHVIGEASAAQLRDGTAAARSGRVLDTRRGGDSRPTR
jgi:cytochrome c biogenesis protein CcmG, thiol:disulfide interchange protein DsbE